MIKDNLARIRERIAASAGRSGRNPSDIKLICVTKSATPDQIKEAISCNITDIGENRIKDAHLKYCKLGSLSDKVKWHMVGHLQTNKVRDCLEIANTIHSLDSKRLAEALEKRARSLGRRVDVFIEVNISGESSRYGIRPDVLHDFVSKVSGLQYIHIIGLMTMAPFFDNAQKARPIFAELRGLQEDLLAKKIPNTDIKQLSMGMSQDFEVAIEEGATCVRIGTAIFG